MEANFKTEELVKVKSGIRVRQFGKLIERSSERQDLYQVEFPYDPGIVFLFEDELERVEGLPCPKCIEKGIWTRLSEPQFSKGGWVQSCPIHGKLYLWGWYRAEEGKVNRFVNR